MMAVLVAYWPLTLLVAFLLIAAAVQGSRRSEDESLGCIECGSPVTYPELGLCTSCFCVMRDASDELAEIQKVCGEHSQEAFWYREGLR